MPMALDAIDDESWQDDPDIDPGMIFQVGFADTGAGGRYFRDICALDDKRKQMISSDRT